MEFNFNFDENKIFDAVVAECTKSILEKRTGEIVGIVSKDVAAQVKSDVVDSGLVEKRVEEVVKRVENTLMTRVNRNFTPVLDEAMEMSARKYENQNTSEPSYKLVGEGRQVRDLMIATLIGFQNDIGNNVESSESLAYQKMLEYVESTFGSMMS